MSEHRKRLHGKQTSLKSFLRAAARTLVFQHIFNKDLNVSSKGQKKNHFSQNLFKATETLGFPLL